MQHGELFSCALEKFRSNCFIVIPSLLVQLSILSLSSLVSTDVTNYLQIVTWIFLFLFYYPFSNKGEDQESSFLPSKVVNNNRCHFLCRLTSQTVRLQPVVTTEEGRVTHIRSQFTVNDYARPPTRIKEYFMLELSKSLHNMRLGRSAAHHMKLAKVTKGCPGLMKINDVCARSGPRRTLCLFPQQRLSRLRHPRQQIDISGSPVNSYMPSCSSAINPQHPHWELLGQKKRKKERNLTFTWYFPSNLPLLIRPHLRGNISASLMARANENDEREGKHLLFSSVAWWKRKCPIDSQDSRPSFVTLTLFHQYRHLHSRQKESSTFFFCSIFFSPLCSLYVMHCQLVFFNIRILAARYAVHVCTASLLLSRAGEKKRLVCII